MKEKKKSIVKYFIKMIFAFFFFLLIQQILSDVLVTGLRNEKYGYETLFEIIWAGLVLVLLLLFKNRYIFTEQRESFKSGFKYIIPEFVISTVFLIVSIVTLATSSMPINIFSIINLLILCLFIGIVEEFLCRGWLLNQFLEKFSNSKKEIILSIIFSSFIFGIVHFTNMLVGQSFINTLLQVVNAGISGVFLALVYYKTKNIWLVVFSHFYWDFSLILMESNQLVDCYDNTQASTSAILSNVVSGVIVVLGYLILCYWLYRKTDLYTKKDKNSNKNYLLICGVIIYIIGVFVPLLLIKDGDDQICPVYNNKKVKNEYSELIYNYSKYSFNKVIDDTQLSFELYKNDNKDKLILKNNITNKSIELSDEFIDYLLVENDNKISIIIQKSNDVVLYTNIENEEINNSDLFLDKVKNSLKEYHTPEIHTLFVLNEINDNYNYVAIDTEINKQMIFDKDDELYFVDCE